MKKAVFITSGHKRIGRLFSEIFAAKGYDLLIHYFSDESEAIRVQQDLQSRFGVTVYLLQGDLRQVSDVPHLMELAFQRCPHLVLLVNNAASFVKESFLLQSMQTIQDQFSFNLISPIFLTQSFAKYVSQGQVVMILDAKQFYEDRIIYSTTKRALEAFLVQSARDLAPSIRVNGIALGWMMPSDGGDDYPGDDVYLKRAGSLEDLKHAVTFLEDSDYVTGDILYIDGGRHLK